MDVEAVDASPLAEVPVEDPQVEEPEAPPQQQPSPPHSNGGVDVVTQLRAWQERGARIEQLLAKKNAKMQEMEETENKLKRLLAMAKRSIDNSKQELAEKDGTIQKLQEELVKSQQARHSWFVDASTRDPRQLLHKVAHGNLLWCLVEYANENDLDDSKEFAWHCFHSEEDIQTYASRATGEPLTLPDFSMTPYEVERVKKSLKEEMDRVQEEFRRYRVRSEITRKQKDAEIRKMSMNVMAKQTEQISEADLSGELQSSKAQIRRLTKAQAEAEKRESDWRRKFEKLMKDYEKLSGTMGETVLAMEWRERYEQSVREKQELEKYMEELKLMTGAFGSGGDNGNGDLQSLRQEFAQYRKRALNAVEQKEKELNDIQAQYLENGVGSSDASRTNTFKEVRVRRMSMESNSSLSGFETPNATKTNEYLKNIVYKYMVSDQDEAKEHMEKAIATVLNFTPAEITAIQEKRKQQQGWFW
ncbi:GRIP domain-containing protein [Phytophthora infestans]|uniref:GRIP domain-containing protein n=1 Tax=Phytophthora infestans TaxID=4787 RepID=A0A833SND7_PHYIN|nr:GRIP domain-containing protein [Phytophthora infestans]KAF4146812.1 GRIP domain-containing protein [Phytophthora infestans]